MSVASFAIIFSHSEGYLFTLLIVSFIVQKLSSLIRSYLFLRYWRKRYFHQDIYITSQADIHIQEYDKYIIRHFLKAMEGLSQKDPHKWGGVVGGAWEMLKVIHDLITVPDKNRFSINVCLTPWAGKIPWRREWQPTPVILPG